MLSPDRPDVIDRDAAPSFEEFFAAQQQDLLRYCWGLTLDPDAAQDVAQETMTRALRDWSGIGSGNPVGWTRTVALNLVRKGWRSTQRGNAALRRLGSRTDDHVGLDTSGIGSAVVAALEGLSQRQREAVVLHHMSDMSVAEVAEAMGIGVPAVKTHLQRGRAALSAVLDDDGRGAIDG